MERDVPFATLDGPYVCSVQTTSTSQGLLGQTPELTDVLDVESKSLELVHWDERTQRDDY